MLKFPKLSRPLHILGLQFMLYVCYCSKWETKYRSFTVWSSEWMLIFHYNRAYIYIHIYISIIAELNFFMTSGTNQSIWLRTTFPDFNTSGVWEIYKVIQLFEDFQWGQEPLKCARSRTWKIPQVLNTNWHLRELNPCHNKINTGMTMHFYRRGICCQQGRRIDTYVHVYTRSWIPPALSLALHAFSRGCFSHHKRADTQMHHDHKSLVTNTTRAISQSQNVKGDYIWNRVLGQWTQINTGMEKCSGVRFTQWRANL